MNTNIGWVRPHEYIHYVVFYYHPTNLMWDTAIRYEYSSGTMCYITRCPYNLIGPYRIFFRKPNRYQL